MNEPDLKLRAALNEIHAILKKNDIAGVMLLCSETHHERLLELSPSWSCVQIQGDFVRIRSKREDYPSKEAQNETLQKTAGLIFGLMKASMESADNLEQLIRCLAAHGVKMDFIEQRIDTMPARLPDPPEA